MDAPRLKKWINRLLAALVVSLVMIAVFAYLGLHTGWIGATMSLIFAEMTRRISGESRPDGPLSWREIFAYSWRYDVSEDDPATRKNDRQ